jgi:hypothetical protein
VNNVGLLVKLFGKREKDSCSIVTIEETIIKEALNKNITEWEYKQEEDKEIYFTNIDKYQLSLVKKDLTNKIEKYEVDEVIENYNDWNTQEITIPKKIEEYSLKIQDMQNCVTQEWETITDAIINSSKKTTNKQLSKEEILKLRQEFGKGDEFMRAFYNKIDTEYKQMKK